MAAQIEAIGYRGPSFEELPGDLGTRAEAAAEFTAQTSGVSDFSISKIALRPGYQRPSEANDFFLFDTDGGALVGSVHFVGDEAYALHFGGVNNIRVRSSIGAAFGYDRNRAVETSPRTRSAITDLFLPSARPSQRARFFCRIVRSEEVAPSATARPATAARRRAAA